MKATKKTGKPFLPQPKPGPKAAKKNAGKSKVDLAKAAKAEEAKTAESPESILAHNEALLGI
jgi:hypothetical protein